MMFVVVVLGLTALLAAFVGGAALSSDEYLVTVLALLVAMVLQTAAYVALVGALS